MPVFQSPWVFLLVLLIPMLIILRKLDIFSTPTFPLVLRDWKGDGFQWKAPVRRFATLLSSLLFTVGFLCLVTSLAEPVRLQQEKIYTSRGTDIVFVLDTSPSMMARDIAGMSRLDAARQAITLLVPQTEGTGFGLVAMASEAALVVPPTVDRVAFFSRLESLESGSLGDGTALGAGLSTAVYHLAGAAAPKKCIVLITDGENNSGAIHPETAARLAKDHGITLYVLGLGTRGSVPLEYVDPTTGKVYSGYLDSQFDSAPLERMATIGGGQYFGVESSGALSEALSTVASREQTVMSFYLKTRVESLYHIFLLAGGISFVLAWVIRRWYLGVFL
ncbi:MAG: VWA domain-containing protein [Spirochaetaceae bacterium]|nr:VWA domain-containing protein [Spirochaetaceae bacterium]